jgi:hypothetical protein
LITISDTVLSDSCVVFPITGAIYEGEVTERRWDGSGSLWLPNGDWYSGSFSQGMRQGYGMYSFADGTVYKVCDGQSVGVLCGKVMLKMQQGDWVRGTRQGKGKLFSPLGDLYEGFVCVAGQFVSVFVCLIDVSTVNGLTTYRMVVAATASPTAICTAARSAVATLMVHAQGRTMDESDLTLLRIGYIHTHYRRAVSR